MCISIYTSRVVLKELGVEDYGIYNVVGGVVAMFSMFSATFVSASQRFLSFSIGKSNLHACVGCGDCRDAWCVCELG